MRRSPRTTTLSASAACKLVREPICHVSVKFNDLRQQARTRHDVLTRAVATSCRSRFCTLPGPPHSLRPSPMLMGTTSRTSRRRGHVPACIRCARASASSVHAQLHDETELCMRSQASALSQYLTPLILCYTASHTLLGFYVAAYTCKTTGSGC